MELSSLFFIFIFLPVFIIAFNITKKNKKLLLFFSLLFYLLNSAKFFVLLLMMIALTYQVSKKVKNNKTVYVCYLLTVASLITIFKYGNLIVEALGTSDVFKFVLPIGISYYSFESISLVSDVYRGKYENVKLIDVATYLSFFPTILSGPIIKFDVFCSWLENKYVLDFDDLSNGLRRFVVGVSKKIIIANQLYVIVEASYSSSTRLSLPLAWAGLIAFALRLYFDFSGCSDMAIGISKMIGFSMPENFDSPYNSLSVSEFFRRWHISLGSFFKDYVYIPLGGNRVNELKWIRNTLVVWILTGVWHGSSINYIIWGLYLGVYIIFEKKILLKTQLSNFVRWLCMMMSIMFSWLIFSTESIGGLLHYGKMMLLGRITLTSTTSAYIVLIMISIIFMIPQTKKFFRYIQEKYAVAYDLCLIIMLIVSLALIVSGSLVTSMYSNF